MNIKFHEKSQMWVLTYGKRHPVTKKYINTAWRYSTEAAAKRAYKDIVLHVEGLIRTDLVPTWENLVSSYLKACEAKGLAKKTIYNADKNLKAATMSRWAARLVDTITTDEIRTLIAVDFAGGSESYRKAILKFVRLAFEHAVESGHLSRNPSPQMKFKIGKKLKTVLTYEQTKILLAKAKAHDWEWYPHVLTALYTGMRSGELYALTWDNIDFEVGLLKISQSWNNKDGFKSPKNGESRIVDMAPELGSFLKVLKLQTGASGFVLPRIGRWDKGEQARELRNFLVAIGLPPVRFHDLRATWATLMLSRGVEPVKVMAMGGWHNMDTMMRYVREAGIDVKDSAAVLKIHDSQASVGKVLQLQVNDA